jgi:hypothetical protein
MVGKGVVQLRKHDPLSPEGASSREPSLDLRPPTSDPASVLELRRGPADAAVRR